MVPAAVPSPVTAVGAAAEPPVTVISAAASKPVTASLKVKVVVKALPSWVEGASIVTVGAVVSAVTVTAAAATLLLPAASVTAAAGRFRVMSARAVSGVTVSANLRPIPS